MFRRLPTLLMTLTLACLIGLHWFLLQSIAWTSMLVGNLSASTFSQAVQRTFDGKHPCRLCKAIAVGKKAGKKQETIRPIKKFEALNQAVVIYLVPPASFLLVEHIDPIVPAMSHAPPTPPPRLT